MKWKILCLLLCLQLPSFAAWYGTGWGYRAKITTQNGKVDADLTDYPIYVNLADFGSGHGIWSQVLSTGADIRVTKSDGTTEVPIQVVAIDTSAKTGELHFKASGTLSGTSNADYYIYYGNGDASAYATSATYGRDNVWTANYNAVWHMNEDPTGSAPQLIDSTGHGNSGTYQGTGTSDLITSGKIGKSTDFDPADGNYYTIPDSSYLDATSSCTMQFWTYIDAYTVNYAMFLSKQSGAGVHQGYTFGVDTGLSNEAYYRSFKLTGFNDQLDTSGNAALGLGAWKFLHTVIGGASSYPGTFYKNGTSQEADSTGQDFDANDVVLCIGTGQHSRTLYIDGQMDEVRISGIERAITWMSTEYNNQNSSSTFYTIAAQETQPVTSTNTIFFGGLF